MNFTQFFAGFFAASLIAVLAYRAKALTLNGAVSTTIIGTLTFGLGGLTPAVMLIIFFVSSSMLTFLSDGKKQTLASYSSKGGRRDYGQVFANGLVAALASVAYGVSGDPIWLMGVAGALATSTADTWGTEIGVLSKRSPRLITTWVRVSPGTSGGITFLGTAAGIAGAFLIGLTGAVLENLPWMLLITVFAGTAGMIIDSLFGAKIQVIYECPACSKETEQHPRHHCGAETAYLRGKMWFNNDIVNLASTLIGAGVGMGLWMLAGS